MKLFLLQLLFKACETICRMTQAMQRAGSRLHQWAWGLCTAENLRTCNERQGLRGRFN